MRLQELFETSEDDRAIILLSAAIYKKIQSYFDIDDDSITHIGKIGDIINTSVPELNSVNIAIEGGQDFVEHSRDVDDPEEYNGKTNARVKAITSAQKETVPAVTKPQARKLFGK